MNNSLRGFLRRNKELMNRLIDYVNNDIDLIEWFHAKNPSLGEARPIELIIAGREEKLIKFIESALNENELEVK